jgi:hypothetical protein
MRLVLAAQKLLLNSTEYDMSKHLYSSLDHFNLLNNNMRLWNCLAQVLSSITLN